MLETLIHIDTRGKFHMKSQMKSMLRSTGAFAASLALVALTSSCGSALNSEKKARLAYVGLDQAIAKSLALGFDGFNAATSANIPEQSTAGALSGTLKINGQIDQGNSDNKGMRLFVGMLDYSDGKATLPAPDDDSAEVRYQTVQDIAQQPALNLSLKAIPSTANATGTYTGTLVGSFEMQGDLSGAMQLNLSMTGEIAFDAATNRVIRKAGTTVITGTAVSDSGSYTVSVTL